MYTILMICFFILMTKSYAIQRGQDLIYIGPNPVQYLLRLQSNTSQKPRLEIEEPLRKINIPKRQSRPLRAINKEERVSLAVKNKNTRHKLKRRRKSQKQNGITKTKTRKVSKRRNIGQKKTKCSGEETIDNRIIVGCGIIVAALVVLVVILLHKRNYMRILNYFKGLCGYGNTSDEPIATDKDREEWEKRKVLIFARRRFGSHYSDEELFDMVKRESEIQDS